MINSRRRAGLRRALRDLPDGYANLERLGFLGACAGAPTTAVPTNHVAIAIIKPSQPHRLMARSGQWLRVAAPRKAGLAG
jgi:hypothetical protein